VLQGEVDVSVASAKFVPKIVAMLRAGRLIVAGGLSRAGIAAFVTLAMLGRGNVEDVTARIILAESPV